MVSKARVDLPEPLTPVTTTSSSKGMSKSRFCKLFWRARRILIASEVIDTASPLAIIWLSIQEPCRHTKRRQRGAQNFYEFWYTATCAASQPRFACQAQEIAY